MPNNIGITTKMHEMAKSKNYKFNRVGLAIIPVKVRPWARVKTEVIAGNLFQTEQQYRKDILSPWAKVSSEARAGTFKNDLFKIEQKYRKEKLIGYDSIESIKNNNFYKNYGGLEKGGKSREKFTEKSRGINRVRNGDQHWNHNRNQIVHSSSSRLATRSTRNSRVLIARI